MSNIRHGVYPPITHALLQEYENWVVRDVENTPPLTDKGKKFDRTLHATIGLTGEAGEILDLVKKQLFGRMQSVDRDKLVHEMGDLFWYFTLLMNAQGITLTEIVTANVEKLCDRYGRPGFEVGGVVIGNGDQICTVCGEQRGHCDD